MSCHEIKVVFFCFTWHDIPPLNVTLILRRNKLTAQHLNFDTLLHEMHTWLHCHSSDMMMS